MLGNPFSRRGVAALFGAPGRPLAIDFGATALKILQVSDATPPAIIAAASLPTPEALLNDPPKRLAFQFAQLPALVKAARVTSRRAMAAIPTWAVCVKHMQVPTSELDQLTDYCTSMLSADLMCDPGMLMCRALQVPTAHAGGAAGSGKTEVIATACPSALVQRVMDALRSANLTCVGIMPEPLAMVHAFDRITSRESDSGLVSLYVDMGYSGTRVTIAHGREVVFSKTIEVGGRYMDECLAELSRCTLIEASTLRAKLAAAGAECAAADGVRAAASMSGGAASKAVTNGGTPHLDAAVKLADDASAVATAEERRTGKLPRGFARAEPGALDPRLVESLGVLTDEVSLCLRYHDALFPGMKMGRAVFVGGESRHVGICHHVARALRVPGSVADPLACFSRPAHKAAAIAGPGALLDLTRQQPGWAVCAGLCMATTDF
ncbi:hypothetical protein BH11PLA1_BH11PLA1_18930 [soil metagenome]